MTIADIRTDYRRASLSEGDVAAAAEVEDLAERRGVAAVLFEELGPRDDIGQAIAEHRAVVGDAGLVGAKTGEERTATGIADRVLHVGAVEADAAGREGVHVRRTRHLVTVAAESRRQVVDDDEEHVGSVGAGAGGGEEP